VLCGDFNDSTLSLPSFVELGDRSAPTWSNGKESSRADHMLVSLDVSGHEAITLWDGKGNIPSLKIPSDHSPIVAVFK
jgi:hypothetical protein